ncbi:tRNA preQ1(34) S-adenosylmethionine ribosyltransferase-isomerase QueA [Candidatus Woesearchaeota archaeon]|nr:tRNA preQ1(34) S-adenosylmethionine ribosyltransferase-isomerase QueA [Candidatus Woesearchaeota archaeon]
MKLSDFDYELPKELIAQEPLAVRDESRLMVVDGKDISHRRFKDVLEYFSKGDVLVLNDTKVEPVKLVGKKTTGAKAEFIVSKKLAPVAGKGRYMCQITSNKVRVGAEFEFGDSDDILRATVLSESDGFEFEVEFDGDVEQYMQEKGEMPVPPYIKRAVSRAEDLDQYQTVYADKPGSIAAPTAGFHFTPELLRDIEAKGVAVVKVTLHVGYGTFLPVKESDVASHKMHHEEYEISESASQKINDRAGRLIVVGTTAFRALESAADELGVVQHGRGSTDLFVTPGYQFKLKPDMMITNFHLPKSTLIMLVAALVGLENVMAAYRAGVKEKYRFYSFGDAMLLIT